MKVLEVSTQKLRPSEYNPRLMPPHELDALTRSIQEYGFVDPVIVNKDGTVIGGHQRLQAAERLGMETVPVVYVDLDKEKGAGAQSRSEPDTRASGMRLGWSR